MTAAGRGFRRGAVLPSIAVVVFAGGLSACSSTSGPRVLLVGTFHGVAGGYRTIQAAVDAAKPGDWVLIGPGDYHETADEAHPSRNSGQGQMGGVYIATPGIHLRGMDRAGVVVDGTKPGSSPCSSDPAAQSYGAIGADGSAVGRNGILVWKADNVSIENLTVCNFRAGTGASGNQVWWNGGADSARIGLHGYTGRYLTATSTFLDDEKTASQYGIFSGNAEGQGLWDQLYASNMNDSGMYVGACRQVCNVTVDHAWMQFSALGYSGTNSGGSVVIENSQFDHNRDGLDTNTQIRGDAPAPQNGACPGRVTSPITHTHSCWVFIHNYVHDNNNPNTPASGSAAAGPVGTGMTVSGGRNDTVMDDTFTDNGAWGVLFVPYPDSNSPDHGQTCDGVGGKQFPGIGCVLDPMGDALVDNSFSHNGFFGNPSNTDFGQITLTPGEPQNCYRGNSAPSGSAPANLEQMQPTCGAPTTAPDTGGSLLAQVLCDTGFGTCPPGANYPTASGVVMQPLPTGLPSMPDPCAGVPDNPWCSSGRLALPRQRGATPSVTLDRSAVSFTSRRVVPR